MTVDITDITADITWDVLNPPDTLCSLLAKLPGNMKNRQNRLAYNLRIHQQTDAEFADIVNFVEEEIILLTDPMFSRDALFFFFFFF